MRILVWLIREGRRTRPLDMKVSGRYVAGDISEDVIAMGLFLAGGEGSMAAA